jgi:hypothetical protein
LLAKIRGAIEKREEAEKWVKTLEIAGLLCFLCSDESDPISGSILKVFRRK